MNLVQVSGTNLTYVYVILGISLAALAIAFALRAQVLAQDEGTAKMQEIAEAVQEGAAAYLSRQFKTLSVFVAIVFVLLFALPGETDIKIGRSIFFLVGAGFSALVGYNGMWLAVRANVRVAEAARKKSAERAVQIAFRTGGVVGMTTVGLGLVGASLVVIIYRENAPAVLEGFGFGAAMLAMFMRVGGGIFTKAADVGADLVGKVEKNIPEDDPRNPATIADNVGDNVGDVAGMGADLFGSYVATVLATMVLGQEVTAVGGGKLVDAFDGLSPILLPMMIAGVGILLSIIGTLFVRISENAGLNTATVQKALNMGNYGSMILTAIACYFLVGYILPENMALRGIEFTRNGVIGAIAVGLIVGTLMSIITEYYTAMGKRPVMSIIKQSSTGHATNIIGGLAIGMESTFMPIIVLAAGIFGASYCAGLYGVAIAAAGMMATTAMQLAIDAFGPIADNAGGIAEMSELPAEVREKTDILDAVGNTTAASGKGFAIASAALTSLALFAAFVGVAMPDNQHIDIYKADVLAALFVGGMIPFIFSSLAIRAVGEAAMAMVEEVRRQFRTIPGIMEGTGKPEYEKCVAISTEASLKKMMLPGAITIISPILIGFTMGPEALGGFLAGATVSGVLMGIFQNNAGGAWDNAKKSFEKGVEINGEMFYKKSEPHKASVTGDTVGDPFKDTSGPSMNILIKLMSIVSLVIAPSLAQLHPTKAMEVKSQTVEISVINSDTAADAKIINDTATTVTISANTKTLLQALQEEGIAPIDNVKIQILDGKITVNGKALTEEQNAKFSSYLKPKNKN